MSLALGDMGSQDPQGTRETSTHGKLQPLVERQRRGLILAWGNAPGIRPHLR